MNIINTFSDKRFTLNGIQYFKNYVSVVRGNKIEIFNCYERKDVLVELTHYNQFSIDGSVFTSAALLQEALLPVIYSRINMGDGSTFAQNNIGRNINLGIYFGDSSVTAIVAKMNNRTTVISAIDTPVVLSLNSIFSSVELGQFSFSNKKYLYLFRPGAGTYGIGGTTVTTTMITQLATLNLTPDDVQNDPGAIIYNIDPVTNGDYLLKANNSLWDFSDSGHIHEDDSIKTYYFSYSVNDVLYFAQFKGTPGIYGLNNTLFEEEDFVATTNSNITPTPTFEQILTQGGNKNISQLTNNGDGVSPYTTVAKLNGLTITVNQAAAEMYLKNSEGTTLATVNLAFLNNEGTTFFYNQTTQKLELKNDAGTILSEVSVSAFVSNLMQTVDFNGANPSILEFKDAAGNVVDSATFTINNIAGLQAALNAKSNSNGSNASGTWPVSITGKSGSSDLADRVKTSGGNLRFNWDDGLAAGVPSTWLWGGSTATEAYIYHPTNLPISIAAQTALDLKANLNGGNTFQGSQSVNGNIGFVGDWALGFNGVFGVQYNSTYGGLNLMKLGDYDGVMFVKNTGEVGIGTTNPVSKLDVNGNINIASGKNLTWGGTYESGNPTIAANGSGIGFYPSGEDTALYITHEKNIGINKTNPLYPFDINGIGRFKRTTVNGGGLATASIIATDAKTTNDGILQAFQAHNSADSEVTYGSISTNIDSSIAGAHSGSLEFRTYNTGSSTLALKLSKEGNVGIGTSTPQAKLDINGSIRVISSAGIEFGGSVGNGHPFIGGAKNDGLYFFTNTANNSNERLRLLPNGNVGIGLSNPIAKLEVNGTGKFSGEVTIPDGTALGSAVNKSQLNLKANNDGSLNVKGVIPMSANLNDYRETGIYTQNSDSAAANGTNYPVTLSGKLEVVRNYIDNTMSYQTYHTYGNGNTIYHRTYYNGSWSDWNELINSDDVTNAVTVLSNYIASNYIPKTGAVTKDGTITFTSAPVVPDGSISSHAINKGQLDSSVFSSRPYKVYTATMTQIGTAAPVVNILENTIGNITWSRNLVGAYFGTLAGAFPLNRVAFFITKIEEYWAPVTTVLIKNNNSDVIQIATHNASNVSADGILNAVIEIRVYN